MKNRWISLLFAIAALYDGFLGVLFVVAAPWVFQTLGVTPPNHYGYIQFPALLLLVFALMFLAIARAPGRNRGFIPYGMLLKASYCLVVFGHWIATDIPGMWKPFAIADLGFLVLFGWAYVALRPKHQPRNGEPS